MKHKTTLMSALILAAGFTCCQAAVTRTTETQSTFAALSTTDGSGNLLLTGDLLNTATAVGAAMPANINNDVLGAGVTVDDGEVSVAGAGPYTYSFGGTVNIGEIRVYSAWQDGRAGQNLDILVSSDGINFTSLINYNETSAGGEVVLSFITDDAGDLATGVTHIRFDPTDGQINGDGGVYREIDVIAAVPEPSSTALLGLGGLALILRRRK